MNKYHWLRGINFVMQIIEAVLKLKDFPLGKLEKSVLLKKKKHMQ